MLFKSYFTVHLLQWTYYNGKTDSDERVSDFIIYLYIFGEFDNFED